MYPVLKTVRKKTREVQLHFARTTPIQKKSGQGDHEDPVYVKKALQPGIQGQWSEGPVYVDKGGFRKQGR